MIMGALILSAVSSCGTENQDNPDVQPQEEIPQTSLILMDSIGVEIGDSCYIFGSIEGLGFTPEGDIAVLDRISADVRLFSPDGEFIRKIGGRGAGPGEMHNPSGLFLFPDGRIGALDAWRSGLQIYSSDGEYQGIGMEVSNNIHIFPEVIDDSSFISMKTEFIFDNGAAPVIAVFIGYFPMTVEPEITYWRVENDLDMSVAANLAQRYLFSVSLAVDTLNGIVYVAPYSGTDYLIERFMLNGEQLSNLELDVEPVLLTEEELRVEEEFISQKLSSLEGGEPQYNVQLTDPLLYRIPVCDIEVDGNGNLWARRGTENEPFFDIWSPEGERIGEAVMNGIGEDSRSWEFEISEMGILAYDSDPDLYQKVYIIGTTDTVSDEPRFPVDE
jgi:hypothetical protein